MKIIKTANVAFINKRNRKEANVGCLDCPFCGAYGIDLIPTTKSYTKGIFKIKYMKIDCYHCRKCGAEWESEPYQVL